MTSRFLSLFTPIQMSKNEGPWGKKPGSKPSPSKRPTAGNSNSEQPDLDDMLRQAQDRMRDMMGGGRGRGGNGGQSPSGSNGSIGGMLGLGAILAAGFWVYQCFYIVQPEEQGVVTRFGEYVETTNEGLHFHLWPIERVVKPKVTRENILEVGFRSSFPTGNFGLGARSYQQLSNDNVVDIPQESLMLTGDENIVDLDFTVRWVISNPKDYLFKVLNPVEALKNISESAMREVIGSYPIDDAITSNKLKIEQEALLLTQKVADEYGLGMRINNVEMQQVQPPKQVMDAFRDVQAAKADAEKEQDQAIGYANDVVPRARGQASQVMQGSEAYKESKIAEATGNASRFISQLNEYKKAPAITRERLYLETMEVVLKNSRKVIMTDKNSGSILPYLPLNQQGRVK